MITFTSSTSKLLAAVSVVSLLFSCKPDLKVNAPYKEIPIVYGLLNQNDLEHYVKINKAFLGEADAYQMAAVRDSSDFGDILDVKIIEDNDGAKREFNLERVLIERKEPGAFPSKQYVYRFLTPVNAPLVPSAKYLFQAKNKESGTEMKAETRLVEPFSVENPSTNLQRHVSLVSAGKISDLSMKWSSAKNGIRYSVKVVFNYIEVRNGGGAPADSAIKSIVWNYPNIKSKSTVGGESMDLRFSGQDFLERLSKIPDSDGKVERLIHTLDFYFDVAGEELNTYMEVNEPPTGIVMEKPDYTNISGGFGVFSSRYNQEVIGKSISHDTCREIKANSLTTSKGFTKWWNTSRQIYLPI
jgi:hypothetical protein